MGIIERTKSRYSTQIESIISFTRIGKFVSVGVIGAVFDISTLVILTQFVGLPASVSNIFSIEVAIIIMFIINDFWTFRGEGRYGVSSVGSRFVRSHIVRAGGSITQYFLFTSIYYNIKAPTVFSQFDLWLVIVKCGSIAAAMVINYVFESLFTWEIHK